MSPFKNNLQKFLIFFFTIIPVILIALGIMRAKNNQTLTNSAPDQGVSGQGTIPPSPSPTGTTPGAITATGKTYQTPYGNVSASITVVGGKITAVSMPQTPDSPPSIYAKPYLLQQALAAGSANIQGVSGATYTSLAFKSSLESAIAQASTQGQAITPNTGTSATAPVSTPSVPRRYRDDD